MFRVHKYLIEIRPAPVNRQLVLVCDNSMPHRATFKNFDMNFFFTSESAKFYSKAIENLSGTW